MHYNFQTYNNIWLQEYLQFFTHCLLFMVLNNFIQKSMPVWKIIYVISMFFNTVMSNTLRVEFRYLIHIFHWLYVITKQVDKHTPQCRHLEFSLLGSDWSQDMRSLTRSWLWGVFFGLIYRRRSLVHTQIFLQHSKTGPSKISQLAGLVTIDKQQTTASWHIGGFITGKKSHGCHRNVNKTYNGCSRIIKLLITW